MKIRGDDKVFNILIAEDDKNLRKLISATLKKNGYNSFVAEDGEKALNIIDNEHIDLVISDIMMPNVDGYDLTESLRESGYNMPILMVTAKETFDDKKKGFIVGADDYMVKPIDIDEMILRIGALLRRSKISNEHRVYIGDIVLDYDEISVSINGEKTTLPKKEFYLLFKLLSYPEVIFTRRQLLDEIWGMDNDVDERTVDVHIKRLREKYYDLAEFEIVTVRGLGYKSVKKV
ncbi:response regulator transcription factor [Metaclostridioides mangenotii]|uniref:Heme response regulator HssR n=1 Tax=Metaclostridioides mangenotii TaxID=1540 RepID=A0ABS4EB99_9FIRM|nr:DNA-binding response OmpR family regulator [Clostridioides mangenotii]